MKATILDTVTNKTGIIEGVNSWIGPKLKIEWPEVEK